MPASSLYCCDALNDHLPESYEARLGEQLRLVEHREPQSKDGPSRRRGPRRGSAGVRSGMTEAQGGVLTLEPITIDLPVEEIEEVRDVWIEIRRRPDRELITAIEVLSPTNKTGEGYWDYQAKRAETDPPERPPGGARSSGPGATTAHEAGAAAG